MWPLALVWGMHHPRVPTSTPSKVVEKVVAISL
jgi:hypothetical protein